MKKIFALFLLFPFTLNLNAFQLSCYQEYPATRLMAFQKWNEFEGKVKLVITQTDLVNSRLSYSKPQFKADKDKEYSYSYVEDNPNLIRVITNNLEKHIIDMESAKLMISYPPGSMWNNDEEITILNQCYIADTYYKGETQEAKENRECMQRDYISRFDDYGFVDKVVKNLGLDIENPEHIRRLKNFSQMTCGQIDRYVIQKKLDNRDDS